MSVSQRDAAAMTGLSSKNIDNLVQFGYVKPRLVSRRRTFDQLALAQIKAVATMKGVIPPLVSTAIGKAVYKAGLASKEGVQVWDDAGSWKVGMEAPHDVIALRIREPLLRLHG